MNLALTSPSHARRSGLLGVVLGIHVGALLVLIAAKNIAPKIMEIPIVVDLLQPAVPQEVAKPQPVVKPAPQRPKPVPRTPTPVIETTRSTQPAAEAVVAAPSEAPPAPPAPAAEAVTQARFDADYLRNPAPPYPAAAKRLGEQGKVVLRVLVSAHGAAENVDVKTSSGSPRLDESAVNTVKRWKFIAAKHGETPVQSTVLVPIIFKLEQS